MPKLAKVRRKSSAGIRNAFVNPDQVQSVEEDPAGAYIAFNYASVNDRTVPSGIQSPDTVEEVIKRLQKPYWHDLLFRIAGILLSVVLVVVAILVS